MTIQVSSNSASSVSTVTVGVTASTASTTGGTTTTNVTSTKIDDEQQHFMQEKAKIAAFTAYLQPLIQKHENTTTNATNNNNGEYITYEDLTASWQAANAELGKFTTSGISTTAVREQLTTLHKGQMARYQETAKRALIEWSESWPLPAILPTNEKTVSCDEYVKLVESVSKQHMPVWRITKSNSAVLEQIQKRLQERAIQSFNSNVNKNESTIPEQQPSKEQQVKDQWLAAKASRDAALQLQQQQQQQQQQLEKKEPLLPKNDKVTVQKDNANVTPHETKSDKMIEQNDSEEEGEIMENADADVEQDTNDDGEIAEDGEEENNDADEDDGEIVEGEEGEVDMEEEGDGTNQDNAADGDDGGTKNSQPKKNVRRPLNAKTMTGAGGIRKRNPNAPSNFKKNYNNNNSTSNNNNSSNQGKKGIPIRKKGTIAKGKQQSLAASGNVGRARRGGKK